VEAESFVLRAFKLGASGVAQALRDTLRWLARGLSDGRLVYGVHRALCAAGAPTHSTQPTRGQLICVLCKGTRASRKRRQSTRFHCARHAKVGPFGHIAQKPTLACSARETGSDEIVINRCEGLAFSPSLSRRKANAAEFQKGRDGAKGPNPFAGRGRTCQCSTRRSQYFHPRIGSRCDRRYRFQRRASGRR